MDENGNRKRTEQKLCRRFCRSPSPWGAFWAQPSLPCLSRNSKWERWLTDKKKTPKKKNCLGTDWLIRIVGQVAIAQFALWKQKPWDLTNMKSCCIWTYVRHRNLCIRLTSAFEIALCYPNQHWWSWEIIYWRSARVEGIGGNRQCRNGVLQFDWFDLGGKSVCTTSIFVYFCGVFLWKSRIFTVQYFDRQTYNSIRVTLTLGFQLGTNIENYRNQSTNFAKNMPGTGKHCTKQAANIARNAAKMSPNSTKWRLTKRGAVTGLWR